MVEKIIGKHSFVFYDSIEDLPISQFHRYSKFLLVESGVGDTIQDIDRHLTRIVNFLDDKKKAHQEILNLRQCLYLIANEQDIHNKTTLCLVKSVDGKEWNDFSDSGLDTLYEMIKDSKLKELEAIIEEIRKRIDYELETYFPSVFEDSVHKNYLDLLRKRAMLQLQSIVNGEDNGERIEKVTKEIYDRQSPKVFGGKDSEEIKFDKQFEDMCLSMAREFGSGIKRYTTMEFYTAYEKLVKESEQLKKMNRRKK